MHALAPLQPVASPRRSQIHPLSPLMASYRGPVKLSSWIVVRALERTARRRASKIPPPRRSTGASAGWTRGLPAPRSRRSDLRRGWGDEVSARLGSQAEDAPLPGGFHAGAVGRGDGGGFGEEAGDLHGHLAGPAQHEEALAARAVRERERGRARAGDDGRAGLERGAFDQGEAAELAGLGADDGRSGVGLEGQERRQVGLLRLGRLPEGGSDADGCGFVAGPQDEPQRLPPVWAAGAGTRATGSASGAAMRKALAKAARVPWRRTISVGSLRADGCPWPSPA